MSQLVGLNCTVCGERISSLLDAEFCKDCKNPVHYDCKRIAHEQDNCCAFCGAPLAKSDPDLEALSTTHDDALSNSPSLLSHLFSFRGRVSRGTYFAHHFYGFAGLGLLSGFVILTGALGAVGEILAIISVLGGFAALMWSEISVTVRRLHDIDRPGSDYYLLLVPFYNIYFGLVLLIKEGTVGPNKYDEDPAVGSKYSDGENLLIAASRLEMAGDWDRAFELYKEASEKLAGQPDGEYAINCIKRLQEKILLSQAPDST